MKNKRSNNATVNTVSAMAAAHTLASKAFAVLMSAILVLGLSPITKVSYADTASNTSVTQESSAGADQGASSNAKSAASSDDEASGKADTKSASTDAAATATGTAATGASSTAASAASKVASKSASSASDSDTNAAATASADNSTEPASNGEEDIALASDNQNDSITPGKYGNYTYEQNTTKNAFTSSDYDAYRDSVATQWLGIAGSFHITAFEEMTIASHVYGNVLTKKLSGNNNFGLDSRYDNAYGYKGLSYIQEYPNPNGNVDGHNDGTFVIGSNNTVTAVDNNNHLAVNGVQFNQPNKLVQDADTASAPFIDLDAVKTYTTQVSNDLAKIADVGATVTSQNGNIYVDYEGDSGCAYVSLTAAELNSMNELYVRGMALNGECSVVINVDMAGATQLNLSKVHVLSPDGQDMGTGETDSTVGYVMFNIKNSTSDMTISLSDRVLASVLAPNSTIYLAGSAAGTYIGTKVNVTAESHARPFRGTLKPVVGDLSVQKVWKDASGKVEEDVDHDPITATVLQRSKAKDGEWSDWIQYETVTLSNDNGWSKSWAKLPKKDTDGTTYEYKIVETDESKAANPDYDSVVTNNGIAWTITNTHKRTAEYTDLSVTKAWLAADGTAESDDVVAGHGAVQAQLYKKAAGGEFAPEGEPVTLSKDNSWSYKWENLVSKGADGTAYEYKVEETQASKDANPDYDSAVSHEGTAWTITNTHKAEEQEFSLSGYSMRAADAPTPEADKVCYVDPKVVKVLEGRTLKAGEFSFQLIDDLTGGVVSTATNDEAGMVDFDKAADKTGNPDNPSCLEFTAVGTYSYTVRETLNQVKDSTIEYSTEVVKFVTTIGQNSDGSLYEVESHYVKDGEIYSSSDHPTITNKVKPLSLGLVKSDDTTGVGLEGAVYGLYRVDDSVNTGAVQVMTASSNDKGLMVFTGADGSAITTGEEYFFQEISAPDGYTVSENKSSIFQIVQASDGTYSLVYPYEASAVAENGIALAAAVEPTVTNGNSGTPTDPIMYKVGTGVSDSKVAITFGKVSSDGTALSGAELAVRDESGTDVSVWTTVGVGHVVDSLVTGKKYVLYEKTAPEGYEKAAEVTFTVDQYGKVVVAEGAEQDGVLNAYAVDSTLNLVDYKQNELVTKKTVVREEGVPTKQVSATNTESTTSSLPKTSDNIPLVPIAVVACIAVVVLCVAARKRRKQ